MPKFDYSIIAVMLIALGKAEADAVADDLRFNAWCDEHDVEDYS